MKELQLKGSFYELQIKKYDFIDGMNWCYHIFIRCDMVFDKVVESRGRAMTIHQAKKDGIEMYENLIGLII